MSINVTGLRSRPTSINAGQAAQLILDLSTTKSPSETARITYRVSAPGVVFVSTGTSVLPTTAQVFPTGTTSITAYALRGPSGGVPIDAVVTPASPPATGGTMVVLKNVIARARAVTVAAATPPSRTVVTRAARPASPTRSGRKAAKRAAKSASSARSGRTAVKPAAKGARKRRAPSSRSRKSR